jgi:hypothetical protein
MTLQERFDQTDLNMTVPQVKAFFLGGLTAEKPMIFSKALTEVLEETETAKTLEGDLKEIWDSLSKNMKSEMEKMFPEEEELLVYMEVAKDQLDFFLTGMSLAGTNAESCKNEAMIEFIEEFESMVEDLDEFLTDDQATEEDGEEFKGYILEAWAEFVSSRK